MPLEQVCPTPGTRRARGLANIAAQYVAKSGLCTATEMESSRGGSIRIQHLTASSASPADGRSRFPKLDECAHFHYELVELGSFQVSLYDEELKPLACEDSENKWWHVSVTSQGKSWVLRRSYENFRMLDQQLHRCIYDRKFSGLQELPPEDNIPGENQEASIRRLLTEYLARFSQISGNQINCGPVLNWLELDNRGHRLLVPDGDNCPINTPAVAAAYSVKRYTAQAGDEISFEVGDMISVIDMPPPEESVWWRGKRGFQVGFFPCECVAVIGDKVPRNLQLPGQLGQPPTPEQPSKPVLRKHGKLIAFFRSFILSRPSRRRLKQSGILKERVFGCDLGEHLLNSGHEIPMVLKCCAEFIETHGIVDGIYRLSGVTSNIQKLRNAFDEDRIPALYEDEAILQDIHSVASLLKMYFRELPNPLCTYQLYHTFVNAIQSSQEEGYRLLRMRDAVQKLPPPHYRTLEYLMRHLARVAECGGKTGMTPRNVAIVWAPNLLRCKELEVGGVAALQGVGVQAVVTEFLVCYADLIFCDGLPPITTLPQPEVTPKRSRPKSLAISTPTKLLSLEEARTRALLSSGKAEQEYIEVGGGPSNLPAKYHTVIELPGSTRKRSGSSSKRSPLGWKSFFSKSGRKSSGPQQRKASTPSELGLTKLLQEKALTESELTQGCRRLRPVKSAESLASGANSSRNSAALDADSQVCNEHFSEHDTLSPGPASNKSSGHSRSVSHDSYFDHLAETPIHPATRPSQLPEEDTEDHFSSSLDLSEIQLNFDLEESEMRIFSEDETLVSTSVGSGSIMSQASPRVGLSMKTRQQMASSRRVPVPRARPEDPLSGCPSADPSPKKQKTCAGPISPQGSSRSKRSRLEEQLACSAAELRYIDSQSPENQQLLVQAEVHQHHQYTKSFDDASPTGMGDSPPNNTSPSLAEATVSDNESFTLHSSSLPTPDTPLLLYTPLLDDETCSTSISTNTTPDYEHTPGSTKYHRLSSSPVPTPKLTPSDSSYENMLVQASRFTVPKYENVPVASSEELDRTSNYSDLSGGGVSPLIREVPASKYINVIDLLQQDNQEISPTPVTQESQITIKYENIICKDEDKDNPYEVKADPLLVNSSDEPASVPPHVENISSEPTLRNYENIPRHADPRNVNEEHLYEDVQLNMPSATVQQDGEEQDITKLQGTTAETEIYQKVKYFRRSIYEVNELVEESRCEVETEQEEEKSIGDKSISSTETNEIGDDSSDIIGNQGYAATGDSMLETSEENSTSLLPQECSVPFILDDSKCTPSNDSSESKDCSNEGCGTPEETRCLLEDSTYQTSSVEGEDAISLISSERRRTSSMRSEMEDSNSSTQLESPQSSPEHRRMASMDLTRRRIDSEIGRDILRERRMKQELEEMRTANQGSDSSHLLPLKQNTKCNVRELLSKFETPVTSQHAVENSTDHIHTSTATTQRLSYPTHENETKTISQVSSYRDANEMRETPSSLLIAVDNENANSKISKNIAASSPNVSRKDTVTPKLSRRSDPSSHSSNSALPPCVRARLAKAARNKLVNSTALSVSLDEGQFLSSSNQSSGQLMRVQTSPDINDTGNNQESLMENSKQNPVIPSARVATADKPLAFTTADLDDPQRRERIERYKEERRTFLREKYRSESFRGERDEILQRLKQKAIKSFSGTSGDSASISGTDCTRSNSFQLLGDRSYLVTSREREVACQSLGSERVSESERLQDKMYGRSSSPKPFDGEVSCRQHCESTSSTIERRSKRGSEEGATVRHRRSSTSDKQKFNGATSSPEKSATASVVVRQRLSAEHMGPDSSNLSGTSESDSDKCLSPSHRYSSRNLKGVQSDDSLPCADVSLKSSAVRSPIGRRVLTSESMFQRSHPSRNVEPGAPTQTTSVKEFSSNTSCENPNSSRKKNTENLTSLQEQLDVKIRLPAGGRFGDAERRPASIPALGSDHKVLNESPRRKSSAECGGNQTSPSFCIRDMAAFFENRRDPSNQTSSRPPPTGKQYLSSV